MSIFDDLFGGGGGSAPDPSAGMAQYFDWIKQQQQQQELDTARAKEQATTATTLSRNELLNRPGFSGDVNVGPSQQRTAATLDASMNAPGADPTQKAAYEAAIAKQASDTTANWRIVSGLQYQAEDALKAISDQAATGDPNQLLQQLQQFKTQYNFIDTTDLENQLQARKNNAASIAAQSAAYASSTAQSTPGG